MQEAITTIIAVLITGILGLIGSVYAAKKQHDNTVEAVKKQMEIQDIKLGEMMERYQAVTDIKLETLTREVRTHNGFAERVPKMEVRMDELSRRINELASAAHV